nr:suppressor of disruption of TFIIS [Ipomoea batatas]
MGFCFCASALHEHIFTNADKVHAIKVLRILGLEDCFEGIICFETLNPTYKTAASDDEDDIAFVGSSAASAAAASSTRSEIFDIAGHFSQPNTGSALPKIPVLCKPSVAAIEKAIELASIDPHRTLFFDDSTRNIQAGKLVGLHTVLCLEAYDPLETVLQSKNSKNFDRVDLISICEDLFVQSIGTKTKSQLSFRGTQARKQI